MNYPIIVAIFVVFFTVTYFINIGIWLIVGIVMYWYFYSLPSSTDRKEAFKDTLDRL